MIDDDDIKQAFDRMARTADGETIYRYFQKRLMGTLGEHAPEDSALRTEHGMRRFAAEMMAIMAKGIDESGGRSSSTGDRATERTVVFRSREPSRAGKHVNIRDHLRATDSEVRALAVNDGSS